MARVLLTERTLNPSGVIAEVSLKSNGALVSFVGTVRDTRDDKTVTHLVYQCYEPLARPAIHRIVDDLQKEHPGLALAIHHRLGWVGVGEEGVVIAATSPHRKASFEAVATAIDRIKHEVPIWKQEHYDDGSSRWREEEPITNHD